MALDFKWRDTSTQERFAKISVTFHVSRDDLINAAGTLMSRGWKTPPKNEIEIEVRNHYSTYGDTPDSWEWDGDDDDDMIEAAEARVALLWPELG